MSSVWYAIADAGGNIYPGTFRKEPGMGWFPHLFPELNIIEPDRLKAAIKAAHEDRGDHEVKCFVETNEVIHINKEKQ